MPSRRAVQRVIGAIDHYARAELVTLAVEDSAPVFLDRRRVDLIEEGLPIAPYHHEALKLDIVAAPHLVNRVRRSVLQHASAAMSFMASSFRAEVLILPASPYESLPASLGVVLESRPLTLAADGMLYREALAQVAVEQGLKVQRYPRKADPMVLAAEALGVDVARIEATLARFGQEAGPPWRKDHKMAAAAALSALGGQTSGLRME